jgi:hypothetical protein
MKAEDSAHILKKQVKYLTEQNTRLQLNNLELRTIVYGPSSDQDLPLLAHVVINNFFGLELDSRCRDTAHKTAREYYYAFLRQHTKSSLRLLGQTLSVCHHYTTVLNSLENFDKHYSTEFNYKQTYDTICELIKKQSKKVI